MHARHPTRSQLDRALRVHPVAHLGALGGERRRLADVDRAAPGARDRIVAVEGDTITVTLKGNQVARWTQPPDWSGAYDTPGRKIAPGTIAFQAHDPGSTTAYANIRVRVKD